MTKGWEVLVRRLLLVKNGSSPPHNAGPILHSCILCVKSTSTNKFLFDKSVSSKYVITSPLLQERNNVIFKCGALLGARAVGV